VENLQKLLEQAKVELRRRNQLAVAEKDKEVENPVETLRHSKWVADQLDEQRAQMNERHRTELRELEEAEGSEEQDFDQLQMRHENERGQMERLLKEHHAKLTHQLRLCEDFEATAVAKADGSQEELDSGPEELPAGRQPDLQDSAPRVPMDKLGTCLSEALHQFRPCSGKCEGETAHGSGARSLWWLAANVAALTWFTEAELQDLGVPPPVNPRTDFYSLADSRFARERKYDEEWREPLAPRSSPVVPPFSLDEE